MCRHGHRGRSAPQTRKTTTIVPTHGCSGKACVHAILNLTQCCTQRCISQVLQPTQMVATGVPSCLVLSPLHFEACRCSRISFVVCRCCRKIPRVSESATSQTTSCDESLCLPLHLGVETVCFPTNGVHREQTHIITSTSISDFWLSCIMLEGGKKSFPVQVTAQFLRKTISKLLCFVKAAVIVFDLYTAYGTNHRFLCGQMVANRLYSVSMTTGHSTICIHI